MSGARALSIALATALSLAANPQVSSASEAGPAAPATERSHPDTLAADLDAARPSWGQAVDAAGVTLALDLAELKLVSGSLTPVHLPGGAPSGEWLFVGRGRLTAAAPDEVEAEQLAYFAGSRSIDVAVPRAVIVPGGRWQAPGPEGGPVVEVDPAARAAGEGLFVEWVEEAQREGFGARGALLRALLGDPVGQHFSGVWLESPELGRLYAAQDPGEAEPNTLGAYRLYELRDMQTRRERKHEARWERERRKREARGLPEVADDEDPPAECGSRDDDFLSGQDADRRRYQEEGGARPWIRNWVTAPGKGADPEGEPPGFEPRHYAIELTLRGEDLDAEGVARIRLSSNLSGLTVVPLALVRGVDVCEVTDGAGRDLAFHERDNQVLVVLAQPAAAGEVLELVVRFAGRPVRVWSGRRLLRDTIHWHPHAGRLDRATYDVTLRYPAGLVLLAAGTEVASGTDGDRRWTRRVQDVPTVGFSFEIDDHDIVETQAGHIDLTFGFYPDDPDIGAEEREEIVTAVKASLLLFESKLGRLPIDRMTVVMTDRGFSQGLLGFLTLTRGALHSRPMALYDNRTGQERRLATIAHEVAHQWWGHMVGWNSYRDQWLSEALATFSSARFMTTVAQDPRSHLERTADRRLATLRYQTMGGQPTASVGSVLLGYRLGANFGGGVYHAVVYDKGAAVFSTLAERLGPEPTWEMLGTLATAVSQRVIRTETFFRAFERMSGQDLGGFYDQYVSGSGVPAVFYQYDSREDPAGGFRIEGVVRQLPAARFRYRVVATDRGWDVMRRFDREPDVGAWQLSLPFVAYAAPGTDGGADGDEDGGAAAGFRGDLTIRGARSQMSIPSAWAAERLELDPDGRVLAEVHGTEAGSAEMLLRLGEHLLRLGRPAEAAGFLNELLADHPEREEQQESERDPAQERKRDQHIVRARMALARLHLDGGDPAAARKELREIDKLLPRDDDYYLGERTLLAARVELRTGQPDAAAILLNAFAARYALELDSLDAEAMLDPDNATPLRYARGEMMALLAVAELGRGGRDATLLIRMADLAGVDVTALSTR